MTGLVAVYAVFGSEEEAASIVRTLVEEGLAACGNILGRCRSLYRWEGKIEDAQEIAVLLKTSADGAQRLIARLAELHSYDVPAAVGWPIAETLPAYAQWVAEQITRNVEDTS